MTNLAISKNSKQALSQNQLAFNKLTARIEKLHKDINKKQLQFDKAINIYSTAIHPLRTEMAIQNRKTIDALWPIYKSKRLSNADQKHFKDILKYHLQEILALEPNEPDEILKDIFKELEGISYEKAKKKEEAEMKDEMQSMFDKMDIDIDINDFDLNEDALAEKVFEAQEKLKQRQEQEQEKWEHRKKHSKKSAKQKEKEKLLMAADEMKQKNISTIYRQLAKLFHPDLEQDPTRRAEKELLMQELTAAYEAKNLHTLLSLELKWIHNENDHLGTLTEEKLAIYLQILREQALELEQEKQTIFQQPRYMVLFQEYGYDIASQPIPVVEQERKDMEDRIKNLKSDINRFQSKDHLGYIKDMIKSWKYQQEAENSDINIFDFLMNDYR